MTLRGRNVPGSPPGGGAVASAPPSPPRGPAARAVGAAAGAVAFGLVLGLAALFVRCGLLHTFNGNLFTDRDLARGQLFLEDVPWAGAETTGEEGARTPGLLLGLLHWLPRLVWDDSHAVWALQQLGMAGALLVVFATARRRLGPAGGAAAAVLFASQPAVLDTLGTLWNPAFLMLPMAIATRCADRWVGDRHAPAAIGFAAAVGLAGMLHVSAFGWALALVPGLWLVGAPTTRRVAATAAAVVAALYAPYVVADAAEGFANTAALLGQGDDNAASTAQTLGDLIPAWLSAPMPQVGLPAFDAVTAALAPVALAVPALGLLAPVLGEGSSRRVTTALLGAVLIDLVLVGLESPLGHQSRYLVALAPAWAIVQAHGLAALAARVGPRRGVRATVAVVLAALVLARTGGLRAWWPHPSSAHTGWADLVETLDALVAREGSDLGTVAGRTVWWKRPADDSIPSWGGGPAVESELVSRGLSFPGSQASPCWLVVEERGRRGPRPEDLVAWVQARVGGPEPTVTSAEVLEIDAERWAVRYTRAEGYHCPSSMAQRYVDLPTEAALRAAYAEIGCRTPQPLQTPEGPMVAWRVPSGRDSACDDGDAAIAVSAERRGDELVAALHSHQLRGLADNLGWHTPHLVHRPRLVLTSGDRVETLPFDLGLVGVRSAVTPLHVRAAWPGEGPWTVRFVTEVVDADLRAPWPAGLGERRPEDVLLHPAWTGAPLGAAAPP